MSPAQFDRDVQRDIAAMMAEGERRGIDDLQTPAPNAAERATAAKVERRNSATGGPWQIHSDHMPMLVIGECDVDNHYVPVCSTDSDDANPAGVDAANARLIVRAVNNYEALVKALEEITSAYRVAVKLHDPNTDDVYSSRARIAIAKALRP